MATDTFKNIHGRAHSRRNIRKAIQTAGFLARRSQVDPPQTLFSVEDGVAKVVDLADAGFTAIGMVTVDGFNFEREDSNSEVQSQGFVTATREDLETSERSVSFTVQEVQKRALQEFMNGTRYDDVEVVEGEVVKRNPEMPMHDEWCLVVVALDGAEGNEYLDAKVLPTIKVQTVGGEQWGGDSERNREITAKVYVDDELGVPEIDIMGGQGFLRTAEDLGWGGSADAEGN